MSAYYNEFEPFAAEWLRLLIKDGHIAAGDVDERSIKEVQPDDLKGYDQCHFFAGIGVWSHSIRSAGFADNTKVWTGSCPCQPFSAAGQRKGIDDERHLWPELHRLIKECRPPVVLGEQVAGKGGTSWFDIVQLELAAEDYASGLVVFPACSVGSPHQRQRLYWCARDILADATDDRPEFWQTDGDQKRESCESEQVVRQGDEPTASRCSEIDRSEGVVNSFVRRREGAKWTSEEGTSPRLDDGRQERLVADTSSATSERDSRAVLRAEKGISGEGEQDGSISERYQYGSSTSSMADTHRKRLKPKSALNNGIAEVEQRKEGVPHSARCSEANGVGNTNEDDGTTLKGLDGGNKSADASRGGRDSHPTNGFWANPDWLYCQDGYWRPVEPKSFPLAYGITNRVGRLRGYGNAIVAPQATAFVEAALSK